APSKPTEVVKTTPAGGPTRLPITHTVESEETLSGIAQRYYNSTSPTTIKAILKANPELKDPDQIRQGMRLLIPDLKNPTAPPAAVHTPAPPAKSKPATPGTPTAGVTAPATYRVQSKDTLSSISLKFFGDRRRWKEIYELN